MTFRLSTLTLFIGFFALHAEGNTTMVGTPRRQPSTMEEHTTNQDPNRENNTIGCKPIHGMKVGVLILFYFILKETHLLL